MDSIFYNGKVRTMDGRTAQAVCVENGGIAFVGGDEEALKMKTGGTKLIDLGGRLTLPGFIDTHMHLLSYGASLFKASLGPASKAELLEIGRAFLKANPASPASSARAGIRSAGRTTRPSPRGGSSTRSAGISPSPSGARATMRSASIPKHSRSAALRRIRPTRPAAPSCGMRRAFPTACCSRTLAASRTP